MSAVRNSRRTIARNAMPVNEPLPVQDHSGIAPKVAAADQPTGSEDQPIVPALSVRAENVLKLLASELSGEEPPPGRWIPSDLLLDKLTYQQLPTARNCGPQTTNEIVRWAETRGKTLRPSVFSGKSLGSMWQHIIDRFSVGEISTKEIAEVLDYSSRRRNARIPVEVQKILLQLIRPAQG